MNNVQHPKTQRRHRLMRLLAHLPLAVLYLVSDIAYPILYHIVRYRRRLVRENLKCAFPQKTQKEIIRIEKDFYHNLCDVFIEAFKLLHISDAEMRRRIDVRNCQLVENYAAQGRNVFMLLGHCGCWEWYQEVCVRYRQPKKGCELYKKIDNPYFSSLMHELRSRWDTHQIEMHQAVREMLKWKAEGEPFLAGFICDQRPGGIIPKDYVTFLSQRTSLVPGAEEIANKIGAVLVYLDVEKPSRGHYILTFRPMDTPPDLATEKYPLSKLFFRQLEETIQRQPSIWLWSHNRWGKWDLTHS